MDQAVHSSALTYQGRSTGYKAILNRMTIVSKSSEQLSLHYVQTQYQAFSMVYIYTLYNHLEKDHIIIQANLIVSSVGILLST